jgi:hypothetical protein
LNGNSKAEVLEVKVEVKVKVEVEGELGFWFGLD